MKQYRIWLVGFDYPRFATGPAKIDSVDGWLRFNEASYAADKVIGIEIVGDVPTEQSEGK